MLIYYYIEMRTYKNLIKKKIVGAYLILRNKIFNKNQNV